MDYGPLFKLMGPPDGDGASFGIVLSQNISRTVFGFTQITVAKSSLPMPWKTAKLKTSSSNS
jgi:hypothetical protein